MPLYNFKCSDGHLFQNLQKLSDPNPSCPFCQKDTKKELGLTSFQLKGDCWAKDGYK